VEDINKTCDSAWIMDANLLVKEIFPFDLSIYLNNLFDTLTIIIHRRASILSPKISPLVPV